MSVFPVLKTGAEGQYPAVRRIEYSTAVLQFVDGSEQRYRLISAPQRSWELSLDLLDEEEAERIQQLFEQENGSYGQFTFGGLWGTAEAECSFQTDALEVEYQDQSRARLAVRIRENR